MNYPKCSECGEKLRISKLEEDRWICGKCNTVYEDDGINNKKSVMGEIDKVIREDKNDKFNKYD